MNSASSVANMSQTRVSKWSGLLLLSQNLVLIPNEPRHFALGISLPREGWLSILFTAFLLLQSILFA